MEVKYINPFLEALTGILEQFGITGVKRGQIQLKETMDVDMDITSVLGMVGGIRGNIAYSFSTETAKELVSAMMMGMPVEELDAMGRSAVGELSNMITGNAMLLLSSQGMECNTSPPSIIFGRDIFFIISSVKTIAIDMETPVGRIQINIGLEM